MVLSILGRFILSERYEFKIIIIYVRKIINFMEVDLKYFSKKNKPECNFILPKIRRYITTQNTLRTLSPYILYAINSAVCRRQPAVDLF